MKPTEEFKTEHKGILRMLRILDAVCDRLERGQEVNQKDSTTLSSLSGSLPTNAIMARRRPGFFFRRWSRRPVCPGTWAPWPSCLRSIPRPRLRGKDGRSA